MYSLILRSLQFAVLLSHYCCNYSLRLMDGRVGIRRTAHDTYPVVTGYKTLPFLQRGDVSAFYAASQGEG